MSWGIARGVIKRAGEYPAFKKKFTHLNQAPESRVAWEAFISGSPFKELGLKLKTREDCEQFVDGWIQAANPPRDRPKLKKQRKKLVDALWTEIKNMERWSKMSDMKLAEEIIKEDIEILRGLE